jgi:hypothetical protein
LRRCRKPESVGELRASRLCPWGGHELVATAEALFGVPLCNAVGKKGLEALADKRVSEMAFS